MSEPKKTESFAGNVMKYSIATYLGFGISGAALIIKGVLPAESYAVPASFMAYTMSLMNVGMLGLDQSLLRFYHEPPAGSTGRSMFAACTRLSVLVMLLVGGLLLVNHQIDIGTLVAVNGCVYRMLPTPKNVDSSLLGDPVGSVAAFSDTPSLADDDAFSSGLSNVSGEGTAIYAVSGLDASTAVAAEVGGKMRLFQRVSYAGKGPGGQGLEDTFAVRSLVTDLTLSNVGTLTGDAANDAIAVLLDHAYLKSTDTSSHKQTLTATLSNGLKLQLGVSGDTVSGCGNWSCPEFFEAFNAAL